MKQNEPSEVLRTLSVTLYDENGDLLPNATTWSAGMVKVSKGGGAFVNTTNLPTPVSGGGDGDFDLILTVAEVDTIGNLRVRFYDDALGTTLLAEFTDQVVSSTTSVSTGSSETSWAFFGGGILKSDVLAIAPALSTLSDAAWYTILAFVNTFKGPACDPQARRMLLILLAAHFGTMIQNAGSSGGTGAAGPVVSESAGGLKRTYAQMVTSTSSSDLSRSTFGVQYLTILGMIPSLHFLLI